MYTFFLSWRWRGKKQKQDLLLPWT
jgi:hypothetical protein